MSQFLLLTAWLNHLFNQPASTRYAWGGAVAFMVILKSELGELTHHFVIGCSREDRARGEPGVPPRSAVATGGTTVTCLNITGNH